MDENIVLRLEGGLGDLFLQNRFITAIKEKHPNKNISAYFRTEKKYSDFIVKYFPFNFNTYETYKNKEETCNLDLGFGNENLAHFLFNTPEKYMNIFKKSKIFYNLGIDEMNWLQADFDLIRYFYFFPKPIDFNVALNKKIPDKFILSHLYPRADKDWLGKEYIINLIKQLKTIMPVVCITTEEDAHIYSEFTNDPNVIIYPCNLDEAFELSKRCELFIGMDSSIRYMPYHFSKPVFVFSKFCPDFGNPLPSNLLRWLVFPFHVFPVQFNIEHIKTIINSSLRHRGIALYPYVASSPHEPNYIFQIR